MSLLQGDIVECRGFGKRRPVIVVSREELNRGAYVLIVPLTTTRLAERKALPHCVFFQRGEAGLSSDCVATCEQVTVMGVEQLDQSQGFLGSLSQARMAEVIRAIGAVMAATCSVE